MCRWKVHTLCCFLWVVLNGAFLWADAPNAPTPDLPGDQEEKATMGSWPKWMSVPPLRFHQPDSQQGPHLMQQLSDSTQRAFQRTRSVLIAPWDGLQARMARASFRTNGNSKSARPSDRTASWLGNEESAAPPKPSSVTEFLALPRPE